MGNRSAMRSAWSRTVRRGIWTRTRQGAVGAVAVVALITPSAIAQGFTGYHFTGALWKPKTLPAAPAVGQHTLSAAHPVRPARELPPYRAVAPAWPAAGTSTVTLTRATPKSAAGRGTAASRVRAGRLPVWVASGRTSLSPDAVRVQVASHARTLAAGANGLLVGLSRADGHSGSGPVSVTLDYAALAKAYGGGYASRLRLYQVPSCALTTPGVAACRTRTPLSFARKPGTTTLTATVALPAAARTAAARTANAAAASGSTAVAVTSGASGSQGDYAATPLLASGTWQTSGTGAYTYSYPIAVPGALGDNAPAVALSYDSQTADGETSARNSQAGAVGESWNYQPGSVDRSYRSCGSLLDSDGAKLLKKSGDQCWGGDNATLSFGSHSGVLVPVKSTLDDPDVIQQWALQGDDGTIVEELKGASNGLHDGVYFRALMTDGSAAYFGSDHAPTAPGATGAQQSSPADDSTDAAWGVPVLHPRSGDPCHDDGQGKASQCDKPEGWHWALDFTVSPTGFTQRYDYSTESNYYALGGGQAATGKFGKLTKYTRAGALTSISYGYKLADAIAGRTPAAQVVFANKQRCQTTSSFDCTADMTDANAVHWPDVPRDLYCASSDTTTLPDGSTTTPANVCVTTSPTFWSTTRLDSITTKVNVAGSGLTKVDRYQLTQVYSDAGGAIDPVTKSTVDPKDAGALQAVMWLQSIRRTGYDASGDGITLNPVTFTGTEIDNRVDDEHPAAPPLYRPRISQIQTESGGMVSIVYDYAPCAGLTLTAADADSNTRSCYPTYWTVPGESKPQADWFNKVTVHQVTASDQTIAAQYKPDQQKLPAGSEAQISVYSYSGAAWHRDDSAQTNDRYRTWDQFRGFRSVTVRTGAAPEPVTQSRSLYLQGMDGDYKADGTRRSVSVDDAFGDSVTDSDWLSGTVLESDTYTQAGGTVTAASTNPVVRETQTQSVARTPWTDWTKDENPGQSKPDLSTLPPLTAHRVAAQTSRSYALLADGQTWRQSTTATGYDDAGRPTTADTRATDAKLGATGTAVQESCTTTQYATPPAANPLMLTYPSQVTTVNGACATATAANLLNDSQTYYGGNGTITALGTLGKLDATGRPTATRTATTWNGTAEQWLTTGMAYDDAGRVTASTAVDPSGAKAAGLTTTTDYSPAWKSTGGNTNAVGVTTVNAQQWKNSTTLDPLRGLTTDSTDANKRRTHVDYDALGRRTAVWLPGRDQAAQSADMTFAYSVNPGAQRDTAGTVTDPGRPSAITTHKLREDGSYSASIDIYDGLGQLRQTQSSAAGDANTGRLISDTFFDSHGWQAASYAAYSEPSGQPSTTLYAANENQIPSETTTDYDGQGRPVTSTLWHNAVAQWHTSTAYPGADETDSTPPAGGLTTQSFTNALGQTVRTTVRNTNTGSADGATVAAGQLIPSGTSLMSTSVRLAMQSDGDLVLSSLTSGKKLWNSGTSGHPGARAVFQADGNLVVYDTGQTQLWASGTNGTGASLRLQNDANMVIYNGSGAAVWKTDTWHKAAEAASSTSYTYTPGGQASTVADSAGNTWTYAYYDLLGRLKSLTSPNSGTTSYDKYDAAGDVLQTTDPRGQQLSYSYDWSGRRVAEYSGAWAATPDSTKELASWSFDTTPSSSDSPNPGGGTLGYPAASTRYVGGAAGSAYTSAVLGYNTAYQSTGNTLTIPAADGFAAPGETTAPASGTVTYKTTVDYTPNTGLLWHSNFWADGSLPGETVTYGYNQQGLLTGFGGYISPTKTPFYLDDTAHDAFGRVQQANYGPSGKQLATFAQYDATTGRTTQTSSMLQTSTTALDVVNYRYDQAGQITAIDDLQNNTTHDTQCFAYDSTQRLTEAWTSTSGITNSGTAQPDLSAAVPGAVGGCTSRTPESLVSGTPTTAIGGPAAYWQSYTYDLLGDRTGLVRHDTGGNALGDVTQTAAFPGADATAAATHPDQSTALTTANPAKGTVTETPTYTDTGYTPNKNAGNTMSRRTSTVGPLTTAFTPTGGGVLCVDDASGAVTAGTKVQVYTCNGSSSQQLTVGTDASIKVKGMCLDTTGQATTAGTKVVINTCDTAAATQQWKATRARTFVNAGNTALCLTDPAAAAKSTQLTVDTCGKAGQTWNTPVGTLGAGAVPAGRTQNLSYDAEGRTSKVNTGDGKSSQGSKYLYDADGNLLLQTTTGGSTDKARILYLFGGTEKITLDVAAKTWTAERNYTGPDGTMVTRTSAGQVFYQLANLQGTAGTAVDAIGLGVTRRYYDPYGNPRGTVPGSWISTDENRGFLGRPLDATTGLNLLGARHYDATQGRFLTPDPLLQPGDPNQQGGYTYAADSPVTGSDPDGKSWFSSVTHAVSSFAETTTQVLDRVNVAAAAGGAALMLLGAGTDALGGALCATGVGCIAGAALVAVGTSAVYAGTAGVIAAVAVPNIAYAVQNGDGGGGGSDNSGTSSGSGDASLDADAQSLVKEHTAGNKESQLTEENAKRSLQEGPDGTTARVMPKENEIKNQKGERNPDLEYLDGEGDIVGYGEVKTIKESSQDSFTDQLQKSVKQLRNRGSKINAKVNEIFIQVPESTNPVEMRTWVRQWQDARRGGTNSVRGFRLHVLGDRGGHLGTYDLGPKVEPHAAPPPNPYAAKLAAMQRQGF